MLKLEKAEVPNQLQICFGEKMRTIQNVTEYGNDGTNMIVKTYDSEIIVNWGKVAWAEMKQL